MPTLVHDHVGSICSMPAVKSALDNIDQSLNSGLFKALAEPTRQQIVSILLLNGRLNIEEIATHVTQDRSVVSRHLKSLHESGVVIADRVGRSTYYELDGFAIMDRLEVLLDNLRVAMSACYPELYDDRSPPGLQSAAAGRRKKAK